MSILNQCHADTFEEAHRINLARFAHEREGARAEYERLLEEKESSAEAVNPDFWTGCIWANKEAYRILKEELALAREKAAKRIEAIQEEAGTKSFHFGMTSARDSWVKAIRKDDPSIIVYW